MSPEVVEYDHVIRVESQAEGLAGKFNEARSANCANECLVAEHTIRTNGADDREILAPILQVGGRGRPAVSRPFLSKEVRFQQRSLQ